MNQQHCTTLLQTALPASQDIRERIKRLTQERATLTKLLKVAIEVERAAQQPSTVK